MEPPRSFRTLEMACLRVCQDFLLHAAPIEILPPGKVLKFGGLEVANNTDAWVLRTRLLDRKGKPLSLESQRNYLRDRTGETIHALPKVLAGFLSFFSVSFQDPHTLLGMLPTSKMYVDYTGSSLAEGFTPPFSYGGSCYPSSRSTELLCELNELLHNSRLDKDERTMMFRFGFYVCMESGWDIYSNNWEERYDPNIPHPQKLIVCDRANIALSYMNLEILASRRNAAYLAFVYSMRREDIRREFFSKELRNWEDEYDNCNKA